MSTTADDPLKGGYWYLDTAVEVTADLPCVLTPNVRLERATAAQVTTLEERLPRSPSIFGFHDGKADKILQSKRPGGGTEYHRIPLPQDQWRHFVLTYKGNGADTWDLQKLCLVVDPPFAFSHFIMTTHAYG